MKEWYGDDHAAGPVFALGRSVLLAGRGVYRWCRWAVLLFAFPFALLSAWATLLVMVILFLPIGIIVHWRRGEPLLPRGLARAADWRSLVFPRSLFMMLVPPRTGLLSRGIRSIARRL